MRVAKASMPLSTRDPAASAAPFGSTSARHTRAPSRAKRVAVARPMPRPAPVTSATLPSSRPTALLPTSSELALFGEISCVQDQGPHPPVEVGEALVLCLALPPASVDLLQDHGQLEVAEDHVPVHLREVPPAPLRIAFHELAPRHETGRGGHGRHDLFEFLG